MLPSLFVPHGAPTFALAPGETGLRLAAAAEHLPRRPRAVVVASAHWSTATPRVGAARQPATLHDFWGFPEPLYDLHYAAPGDPDLAAAIVDHLRQASFDAETTEHGLDHAVWIPLRLMFPNADLPVVPLSIQPQFGPEYHYRLGQALAPLLDEDVLVVGSGNLTHSLRDYQRQKVSHGDTPPYVRAFADWIWQRIAADDTESLCDYRRQAPEAARAHPTEDHLLPLFVALGAAGAQSQAERLHAGVDDLVLAMDAYAFHPATGARQ
jgi:4,5-DOPA dioxygenase extradiol